MGASCAPLVRRRAACRSALLIAVALALALVRTAAGAARADAARTCDEEYARVLWPLPRTYTCGGATVGPLHRESVSVAVHGDVTDLARDALRRLRAAFPTAAPHDRSTRRFLISVHITEEPFHTSDGASALDGTALESYTLRVEETGADVRAPSELGALHALTTLRSLLVFSANASSFSIRGAPWYIQDEPRFQYRGLLIDTARHYLPVRTIERIIDGMAMNKLNVLHWHIVDAQSFPLVLPVRPALAEKGAYHPLATYTPTMVQHIVAYAERRAVRVVPEIDMPGHTHAWGKAYPELLVCMQNTTESGCCAENPCGQLDPSKGETYRLVEDVLTDVGGLFTDPYLHMGADEVSEKCWDQVEHLRGKSAAYWFREFASRALQSLPPHRTPVMWEEVLRMWPAAPTSIIVQIWRDENALADALKRGHRVIVSQHQPYYLDCGFKNWCTYNAWYDMYRSDPVPLHASAEHEALILGAEVCMWSELVDESNVESRIWPRAAAFAERAWSARDVADVEWARERLERQRCRMRWRGIPAAPLSPGFAGFPSCESIPTTSSVPQSRDEL